MTTKEALSKIKKDCEGYSRDTPTRTVRFANGVSLHYALTLSLAQDDIITAMEKNRDYSAPNYYQKSNFPRIKKNKRLFVFDTIDEYRKKCPSRQYRCPRCGGISKDPQKCTSGKIVSSGSMCDWKAFGLFGTLGKGCYIVIKEDFLKHPKPMHMFIPVELEGDNNDNNRLNT